MPTPPSSRSKAGSPSDPLTLATEARDVLDGCLERAPTESRPSRSCRATTAPRTSCARRRGRRGSRFRGASTRPSDRRARSFRRSCSARSFRGWGPVTASDSAAVPRRVPDGPTALSDAELQWWPILVLWYSLALGASRQRMTPLDGVEQRSTFSTSSADSRRTQSSVSRSANETSSAASPKEQDDRCDDHDGDDRNPDPDRREPPPPGGSATERGAWPHASHGKRSVTDPWADGAGHRRGKRRELSRKFIAV